MANEKRLIDANALLRHINNYYDNSPFPHPGTNWRRGFEFAAELILSAPTVDAVEVVRCKECWKPRKFSDGSLYCPFTKLAVEYDDFCSYGERKDNG